jgi:beta-lactamase class A
MRRIEAVALLFVLNIGIVSAGSLNKKELQMDLERLAANQNGRIGVCAGDVCVHGDERFSLQSVMKLIVAATTMDMVDHHGWRLDEPVTVRKQDLSLYAQPIADLVKEHGYKTAIGDLVRRAVVDSDSAATDILVARLGGPAAVQAFLNRKSIKGVRFDRDEKHLQTEIVGLQWRPEYVDAALLNREIEAVPKTRRDSAYQRYQKDVRDTATPKGMTELLQLLADGTLLSAASTKHLLDVMTQTVTGPDRLKAGTPKGWTLAHKTGTSGGWNGITAATNDVGVLIAPNGDKISIAVFIGDSAAPSSERAALMAKIAAATTRSYR